MDSQIKDFQKFLLSASKPYSPWHKKKYEAIGMTKSRDYLEDLNFDAEIDILLVGIGDISNVIKTVASSASRAKSSPQTLNFLACDIDPAIIARNIVILEIIENIDLDLGDDLDFLWCVWYNLALKSHHYDRLVYLLERLIKDGPKQSSFWTVDEKLSQLKLRQIWAYWLALTLDYDEVNKRRFITMASQYYNMQKAEATEMIEKENSMKVKLIKGFVTVCLMNVYQLMTGTLHAEAVPRYPPSVVKFYKEVETYYLSGCADPHFGHSTKAFTKLCRNFERDGWILNPTMLNPGSLEFPIDFYASPYYSYFPLAALGSTGNEIKDSLGEACFKKLRRLVTSFRNLADSKKVKLSVKFGLKEPMTYLANINENSSLVESLKFDFINVAITDDVGLLPTLLTLQPRLKNCKSVLCTETLEWRRFSATVKDWYSKALCFLEPSFLPTVLGLRLAENLELGKIEPMTDCQLLGFDVFKYKEMLMWTSVVCFTPTPIKLDESCCLKHFLKHLVKKVFVARTEFDHQYHTPYVLWKLAERMGKSIQGGVNCVLEFINENLPFNSPCLLEWNIILSVRGFISDKLVLVKVPFQSVSATQASEQKTYLSSQPPTRTVTLLTSRISQKNQCSKEQIGKKLDMINQACLREEQTDIEYHYISNTVIENQSVQFLMRKSVWDENVSDMHLVMKDAFAHTDPVCLHNPANFSIINTFAVSSTATKPSNRRYLDMRIIENQENFKVILKATCPAPTCLKLVSTSNNFSLKIAHKCKKYKANYIQINFSCAVEKSSAAFLCCDYDSLVMCIVPKVKSALAGPGVLPRCKLNVNNLPSLANGWSIHNMYMRSMFCIPGDDIIVKMELADNVIIKYTFFVCRLNLAILISLNQYTTFVLGETVIHVKSVYSYREMPLVHVVYCPISVLKDKPIKMPETEEDQKAIDTRQQIMTGLEHSHCKLNYSIKVHDLICDQLEANSNRMNQAYEQMFPKLKQSYLQLTFPRISPCTVGTSALRKYVLENEPSEESKRLWQYSIPPPKYMMQLGNTCAYCGLYTSNMYISKQMERKYCGMDCETLDVIASDSYGNPLFDCSYVPRRKILQCQLCKKNTGDMKECAKCHSVYYCSRDCQVLDWKEHKIDCKKLAKKRERKKVEKVNQIWKQASGSEILSGVAEELSRMTMEDDELTKDIKGGCEKSSDSSKIAKGKKSSGHNITDLAAHNITKSSVQTQTHSMNENKSTKSTITKNKFADAGKFKVKVNENKIDNESVDNDNKKKKCKETIQKLEDKTDKDCTTKSETHVTEAKLNHCPTINYAKLFVPTQVKKKEGKKSDQSTIGKSDSFSNQKVHAKLAHDWKSSETKNSPTNKEDMKIHVQKPKQTDDCRLDANSKEKSKKIGRCNECGHKRKLKKCALCRKVAYCGKDCQIQAWPIHQKYCEGLK